MVRIAPAKILVVVGTYAILAASTFAAEAPTGEERLRQIRENGLALMTKLLASGVFVAERSPEELLAIDLQPPIKAFPSPEEVDADIDYDRQRVTISAPGIGPRTAVYHGDQGCTLLPHGEEDVFFTPVDVPSTLPPASTQDWPMGDRPPDEPLPAEVDQSAVDAALDFAFDDSLHKVPQRTRAMVVVYRGRIIGERYAPGFTAKSRHINWSMGKSITAALIGLLVGDGHFTVDDPAPLAEWQSRGDPRRKITIANLLHMSSGLEFGPATLAGRFTDADNHTAVYFGPVHVFDYSVNRPLEHPPGTVWRYRNCDPLTLGKIIRQTVEARGEEYLSYPQRALFDKIGMRDMVLEVDPWGNFIMTGFEYGTARDWARFGLLHLENGNWQGERILPEGWVDFVRTPAPAAKAKNYGGLFWLNAGGEYEKLPRDMYWPAGHHGQLVMIIPSREMVVVRLGLSNKGGTKPYMASVLEKLLAAVGKHES